MNLLSNPKFFIPRLVPFKGCINALKNMATSERSIKSINYDQLKNYLEKNTYIIDVREKMELLETGRIPKSVNIPVGEIEKALQLSEAEFICQYGSSKPKTDTEIIFSCRSGKRSQVAAHKAVELGFENVINYNGGWLDWEKNLNQN